MSTFGSLAPRQRAHPHVQRLRGLAKSIIRNSSAHGGLAEDANPPPHHAPDCNPRAQQAHHSVLPTTAIGPEGKLLQPPRRKTALPPLRKTKTRPDPASPPIETDASVATWTGRFCLPRPNAISRYFCFWNLAAACAETDVRNCNQSQRDMIFQLCISPYRFASLSCEVARNNLCEIAGKIFLLSTFETSFAIRGTFVPALASRRLAR
jgi:hypothetical protein